MAQFKVLREGISQRAGDLWISPRVGTTIELSDSAARHMLSEVPPFVEEVKEAKAVVQSRLSTIGKKKEAQ